MTQHELLLNCVYNKIISGHKRVRSPLRLLPDLHLLPRRRGGVPGGQRPQLGQGPAKPGNAELPGKFEGILCGINNYYFNSGGQTKGSLGRWPSQAGSPGECE